MKEKPKWSPNEDEDRPNCEDNITVQNPSKVDVVIDDGIVDSFMDFADFRVEGGRLEQSLGSAEPLAADEDHLPVGKLESPLERRGECGHFHPLFKVELPFNVAEDFSLRNESIVASSQIEMLDRLT